MSPNDLAGAVLFGRSDWRGDDAVDLLPEVAGFESRPNTGYPERDF
jgi:hypothetical protein